VHTWNLANPNGGTGIALTANQNRLVGVYLDFTDLLVVDPEAVVVADSYFLCGGRVVLAVRRGTVSLHAALEKRCPQCCLTRPHCSYPVSPSAPSPQPSGPAKPLPGLVVRDCTFACWYEFGSPQTVTVNDSRACGGWPGGAGTNCSFAAPADVTVTGIMTDGLVYRAATTTPVKTVTVTAPSNSVAVDFADVLVFDTKTVRGHAGEGARGAAAHWRWVCTQRRGASPAIRGLIWPRRCRRPSPPLSTAWPPRRPACPR
jgi:hypothetical protein